MAQAINQWDGMDESNVGVLELGDQMISDLEPWSDHSIIAKEDDMDEDEAYFLEDGDEDEDSDADSDYDDDFGDEEDEEIDDDFESDDDDY